MSGPIFQLRYMGPGSTINFGPTLLGTQQQLFLNVMNTGTAPLTITAFRLTSVTGGLKDFTAGTGTGLPLTILPGNTSGPIFSTEFLPSSPANTIETALVTFTSNAIGGVQQFTLEGIAVAATAIAVEIRQNDVSTRDIPIAGFGTVVQGTTYTSPVFQLVNPTTSAITVTLTADAQDGYSLINVTGTTIAAGSTIGFQIQLVPNAAGLQDDLAAVTITYPGQVYAQSIEAWYTSPQIASAFTLQNTQQALLLAFANPSPSLTQAQPNNINCEEVCTFSRQYDFKDPDHVKEFSRMLIRYERLGTCTITITYSAISPIGQPSPSTVVVFDSTADGNLRQIIASAQIAGDIIEISWSRLASAGQFSIVGFAPYLEPRGEVIEAT